MLIAWILFIQKSWSDQSINNFCKEYQWILPHQKDISHMIDLLSIFGKVVSDKFVIMFVIPQAMFSDLSKVTVLLRSWKKLEKSLTVSRWLLRIILDLSASSLMEVFVQTRWYLILKCLNGWGGVETLFERKLDYPGEDKNFQTKTHNFVFIKTLIVGEEKFKSSCRVQGKCYLLFNFSILQLSRYMSHATVMCM